MDITQTLVDDFGAVLQQTQTTDNAGRRRRQASSNNREVFTFDANFNASEVRHSVFMSLPNAWNTYHYRSKDLHKMIWL